MDGRTAVHTEAVWVMRVSCTQVRCTQLSLGLEPTRVRTEPAHPARLQTPKHTTRPAWGTQLLLFLTTMHHGQSQAPEGEAVRSVKNKTTALANAECSSRTAELDTQATWRDLHTPGPVPRGRNEAHTKTQSSRH